MIPTHENVSLLCAVADLAVILGPVRQRPEALVEHITDRDLRVRGQLPFAAGADGCHRLKA